MAGIIKEIWLKVRSFLEREMNVTLLFWVTIFFILTVMKILGLGKMK